MNKIDITDEMINNFIEFMSRTKYCHHPEVPYLGTENGDSEEQWQKRLVKTALTKIFDNK